MAGAILSTGKYDYGTPTKIVALVRSFFGQIELDPATNDYAEVYALDNIMLEDPRHTEIESRSLAKDGSQISWTCKYRKGDGLQADWAPRRTYVNPPFSINKKSVVGKWVAKAYAEYLKGAEVVMLIPCSVETDWWQNVIFPKAAGICWFDTRQKFIGGETTIPKPTGLVYFGNRPDTFCSHFRPLGHTYNPSEVHS
jgi:hypothetical protein